VNNNKKTKAKANFAQGHAVAERETADGWGGPATGASPLPVDQHHTRRSYVGYGQLPPDVRRQPALAGDELARIVTNVSPAQLVHGATRGMPGKRDAADGTPRTSGRIKAVVRYGLGPLVQRAADLGHDPIEQSLDTPYRRQPEGPRPDVLGKYMSAAELVPAPTGYGNGYPRLPRYHQLSPQVCMGDDLYAPFDQRGQ
jgi:hypothetical protein